MSETEKFMLENVLEHLNVCEKRFEGITVPRDFMESENGNILLDSIVTRLIL